MLSVKVAFMMVTVALSKESISALTIFFCNPKQVVLISSPNQVMLSSDVQMIFDPVCYETLCFGIFSSQF